MLAVLVDAGLYQLVDMGRKGCRVDGEKIAGGRDDELSREVYPLHVFNKPGEFRFNRVYMIRDIFVCEKSVRISGKLLFCIFFHGRMDKDWIECVEADETIACRKVSILF